MRPVPASSVRAALRGSRAYEAAPSYPVFPTRPTDRAMRPPPVAPRSCMPVACPAYSFEVGARYWYSTGKLSKDLYDDPRSPELLNSRLTYDGLTAHSFEAFGRVNLPSGLFLKGFAGISGLPSGQLNDEDFPFPRLPVFLHAERSARRQAQLCDGRSRLPLRGQSAHQLSLFGGFGYIGEKVNAYGCTQIAGNPFVCVPAIGVERARHHRGCALGPRRGSASACDVQAHATG